MDASKDVLSGFFVSLFGVLPDAGLMALSPNKAHTVVFSPSSNQLAIIDNAQESVASGTSAMTLPGSTESLFVASDNLTAFVAVPTAAVPGQSPGVVERVDISAARITATIPVPGARFLVPSPGGNQILVFSDNSDTVTLLAPSLIDGGTPLSSVQNTSNCSRNLDLPNPCAFDHPVWGVFNSGGSSAFIMNCGAQCGGASTSIQCDPALTSAMPCASVSLLDLSSAIPTVMMTLPVPAATYGLLNGSTLYVAGTSPLPSSNDCPGVSTASVKCGRLTVIDAAGFAVTNSAQLPISDGHHDRMQMAANGQLFIGSHNCTNINISGGEVRGCLTIVNTASGSISASRIIVPPQNGDVTGIEPVLHRSVVYVCQGGSLGIYDTTTDRLQTKQVSIVGQAIDVKVVDF